MRRKIQYDRQTERLKAQPWLVEGFAALPGYARRVVGLCVWCERVVGKHGLDYRSLRVLKYFADLENVNEQLLPRQPSAQRRRLSASLQPMTSMSEALETWLVALSWQMFEPCEPQSAQPQCQPIPARPAYLVDDCPNWVRDLFTASRAFCPMRQGTGWRRLRFTTAWGRLTLS